MAGDSASTPKDPDPKDPDPKDPKDPKDPDPKDPNPDDDADDGDAEKWKALARKHERDAKKARAEADKLRTDGLSDQDKAIEKAKQEARDEALAEALSDMVDTTLEAVAAAKLADPSFVRMIADDDREGFIIGGKVDRKAVEKSVDALVKKYPNLAKSGSKPGALPGGSKGSESSGVNINDELRRRAGRGI